MAKKAVVAVSLALLTITSPFMATPAIAEVDVEALKAQLASAQAGRDYLRGRLERAIAFSSERGDKLEATEKKLAAANEGRNDLRTRLGRANASWSEKEMQLTSATAGRDKLRARLARAIAYSSERGDKLEATEMKLASATAGRNELRARLARAIAFSSERGKQLESANAGNEILRASVTKAMGYWKSKRSKLEQQLEAAENKQADWAAGVVDSLQASIGGLQGTEIITNGDNTVKVQVGNSGLFRTGGNALSENGRSLLTEIAPQLSAQNAAITVIGHTDSIPVGESNRFANNEALSFARAVSTLQFLRGEGIPTQLLSAAGYGADNPIASNDTEEGRQQNRRVDIVLRAQ